MDLFCLCYFFHVLTVLTSFCFANRRLSKVETHQTKDFDLLTLRLTDKRSTNIFCPPVYTGVATIPVFV